jgi:hypothetical protein
MAERFDSLLAYRENQLHDTLCCTSNHCWRCRAEAGDLCSTCYVDRTKPEPPGWTPPQVADLADIPARTVQWWRKNGVLGPTFLYGPAHHPMYSFADIVAHRVFEDLNRAKVPRQLALGVAADVSQYTVGGSFPCFADRYYFGEESRAECEAEGDLDIWERARWLIVPLVQPGDEARYDDEAGTILYYDSTVPTPAALADRLSPRDKLVLIDATRVAYPIARTVQLVGERVDAYVRTRHKLMELPWWMVR